MVRALIMAAVVVAFFFAFQGAVPSTPFGYDESDYMTLSRSGFWHNYVEPESLNLVSFVQIGMKALHGEMARTGLSDFIREKHDTSFLRHYHGPLLSYWLVFARALTGGSEYGMRLSGFIFPILTFLTLVIGIPWAFGKEYGLAGWLAGTVFLLSVTIILTAAELSCHVIFVWASMLSLILTAKFSNYPTRQNYYVALAGCAFALAALEYGVLLFASLAVAVWLRRKDLLAQWKSIWRWALASVGVTAAALLVLWPAGLLKGTLVEGFLFIGYLTKFRKGSFGTLTPLGVWELRFQNYTADCIVVVVCLALAVAFLWRSPRRNALLPICLFAALMLGTTLKNTAEGVRYFSAFPAPLIAVGAILMMERLRTAPSRALALAIVALGLGLASLAWRPAHTNGARRDDALIAMIAAVGKTSAHTILVPTDFRPPLTYYFPDRAVQIFLPDADRQTVASQLQQGNPDLACVYDWQALPGAVTARFPNAGREIICSSRSGF